MNDHIATALEDLTAWAVTVSPVFNGRENRTPEQKAASAAAVLIGEFKRQRPRCCAAAPEMLASLVKMRGLLRQLQPAMNVMAREVMDDIIREQIDPVVAKASA